MLDGADIVMVVKAAGAGHKAAGAGPESVGPTIEQGTSADNEWEDLSAGDWVGGTMYNLRVQCVI